MNKSEISKDEKISHHTKAAEHLELAAKHYHEAAKHLKGDLCEKAGAETLKAMGHVAHAKHHSKKIVQACVCDKKA